MLLTRWLWHAWRNVSVKKRGSEIETEKRRKNPVKSHSEQKTAQFSCLCCEFCRLGWKTSSTVRVDISATPPLSERLTAQTSSQLRSRSTTLLFLFLFGNLKKEKKFTYTLQFVLSALHGGPLRSKVCI